MRGATKTGFRAILAHSRLRMRKKGQILMVGIIIALAAIGLVLALPLLTAKGATQEEMKKLNEGENVVEVKPDLKQDNGILKPTCTDGQILNPTGQCVFTPCPNNQPRNNLGQCVDVACPSGQVKNIRGECQMQEFAQPSITQPCKPSGYIKSAYVRSKGNVGEIAQNDLGAYPAVISYQFQVTSDCEATYYFESGLNQGGYGLTILNSAGSKCDGNNHYSGRFITMSKNTIVNQGGSKGLVDIAFFPLDYGKNEKLTAVGGVYSGCMKDGGVVIDEFSPKNIDYKGLGAFSSPYSSSDISLSWVRVK